MAANLLHPRNVTYAKPKQETIGVRLGQRFLPCCHSDWIAAVDICNTGGDNDALCSSQEQGCLCERLASSSFAIPNRPVTQLFQFGSGLLHARRRQHVQLKCPNSKRAKLNRFLSHGFPPVRKTLLLWMNQPGYSAHKKGGTNAQRAQKTAPLVKHQREICLGFLRVAAEKCRDIQV